MKIDPDDYAYPLQVFERSDGRYLTAVPGMSIRAVIAKDLMAAMISTGCHPSWESDATEAVLAADLLIAELNKGPST